MKAIAKHECTVALYVDLNAPSLTRVSVSQGEEITGEVHEDKRITTSELSEVLGERCVTFFGEGYYIPCFEKDFEFIEE